MWILYVITALVVPSIQGALHPTSPCPSVFSYEGTESERDRWYGIVLLTTEESLVGVRLDIKLDRPSQILVSWLGDVSTEDNERYTILSLSQKLHPGPPLSSRFMVKFDANHGIPQVRTIRLNGRQICPPDPNFPIHHGSKGYSETRYMTERSTKRPDPVFPPPEVDLSPNRPVVKTTTEDYYNDFITTKRTTTRRYNYEDDYLSQKQTNKNNYNSYEQENAVTQTTTSNYYQGVHYTERPTSSFNVDSRPRQSSYSDDNPSHTDAHRTAERHTNSGQNNNGDNSNNYVQPKPTTKRPAIQNSNSNNYGNNGRNNNNNNNNNNNRQTTTHRPAVANSNSNNQKNNNSSSQQSKPVRKPEFSVIHVGVNSGTRVVTTRNNDTQFQKTTPNSYETSTQRTINRVSSDVVYPNPSSRPSSKNSPSKKLPAATTSRYHQRTADDLETASSNVECGRVQVSPAPLITNGQNTARGQWPWHIALYRIEGINLSYICGGSLISDSHVITAAHCVTKAPLDRPLPADVLVVYLGKYHLCQFSDDGGVQNKQVRDIHVFPQYNSSSFTGDIAVLELSSPVQFTTYVRPVCLWDTYETELSAVEGKEGTVVGWGYDENDQVTEELKMARMPVVSQETCIRSYPQFFSHFTSNKTFCAGFRKGTSVCNGDSGGGMVFPKGDIWYLRGLVSITVARQGVHVCDTRHFVVFADVAKYLHWIREIIT